MKITKPHIEDNVVPDGHRFANLSTLFGHILLYLGLVALGVFLILGAVKSYRIYTAYQKVNVEIDRLQAIGIKDLSQISPQELAQLKDSLSQMTAQFEILQREVEPLQPLLANLGWAPVYGGDLQAAPWLVTAGYNLSRTSVIMVEVLSDPLLKRDETDWLPALVARLNDAQPDIDTALTLLDQSQTNLNRVRVETLSPELGRQVQQVQQVLPHFVSGVELAAGLPYLLGSESPQTYLLLSPNADELRPIGGFITMAGHITFDQGRVVDFRMQDSATVDKITDDYPYPPGPIYDYMNAGYWLIRDAPWSPDYPTTADLAIDLYEMGQGIRADGAISLDQYGLAQLLRAFKPLKVDGEKVTSDNIIKLMRQHWSPNSWHGYEGAWGSQRKSFMVELSEVIRQTIEQQPATIKLPILAQSVRQALAEKRLLVYLKNPPPASRLAEKNWSGAIKPGTGDYLMLVDANLGFNKASALVQRQLAYEVKLATDGSLKGHARLTYQHQGQARSGPCVLMERFSPVYENNMQGCYWNYMRLVTPATAQLVSGPHTIVEGRYLLKGEATTGEIDEESLLDKQSWGQLFLLAPDHTLSLDFEYTLPAGTARMTEESLWEYTLYLQKQPGTEETSTEVTVTLPDGAWLQHSQPAATVAGTTLTFATNLTTDQPITLYYGVPEKE